MAVVGHAYVVVRAITDKVDQDIAKAFSGSRITNVTERSGRRMGNALVRGLGQGVDGIDNKLTRLGRSFNNIYPEADGLRRTFVRLNRVGMALQSGLGALGGSIAALVGGVGALLGPLAGAASGLVALGSAAISARIGLGVAQYALKGIGEAVRNASKQTGGYGESVEELREKLQQLRFDQEDATISVDRAALNLEKARQNMLRTADLAPNSLIRRDAEIAFREAELAYRRAKDRQEDLKAGLTGEDRGGAAADPFADLTPSQRAFAEYLLTIQDIFKDLREAAASGFLPILQQQIERLINSSLLDILEARFYDIGRAAGLAIEEFNDVLLSGDNLKDFNDYLKNTADVLPTFGRIFGNTFDGLLSLLIAADPLTRRFIDFLDEKSGAFARLLDVRQARGELEDFFDRVGDIGADFGAFFGGIFDGLGDIIEANFGPGSGGDMLLQWLRDVGEGFGDKDLVGLDIYFRGVADNVRIMSQALGGAIESLVRMGSDPAVGRFWEILDRGSYSFDQVIRNFVQSGPAIAELLVAMTDALAILSDQGPVDAFLKTLGAIIGGFNRLLEVIEPLIKLLGGAFGFISAVALAATILSKIVIVLGSFVVTILSSTGAMVGLTAATFRQIAAKTGLTAATQAATAAMVGFNSTNPLGWIMLATAAVIGFATAMSSIKSDNIAKGIDAVTAAISSGEGSLLEASRLAITDFEKLYFNLEDIGDVLDDMQDAQAMAAFTGIEVTTVSTRALYTQLEAVGTALANIAVHDVKDAQNAFNRFRKELGNLTKKELLLVFNEMDDFQDALVNQADQLGINVRDLQGNIDQHKLLAFATGTGEIALRNHIAALEVAEEKAAALRLEQEQLSAAMQQVAIDAGGFSDSLREAFEEIETEGEKSSVFNPQKAIENMRQSIQTTIDYNKNLFKLQGRGLSTASLDFIREQGALGPQIAAGLLDVSMETLQEFNAGTEAVLVQSSDQFAGYLTDLQNMSESNTITQGMIDGMRLKLLEATTQQELEAIGEEIAKQVAKGANAATRENPLLLYFNGKLSAKETLIRTGFKGNISGFIKTAERYIPDFAYGGFVSGPGGPRSDSIPAMLSNGEYVVNARSTSRYRNILERINAEGNRYADGGMVSGSSLGAGVNIVVNPSPGMDERELAAAVSRRIAYEIKKGTI